MIYDGEKREKLANLLKQVKFDAARFECVMDDELAIFIKKDYEK
jgi:hypothetical protein